MDLSRLRPIFEERGPFLTVHAEVGRASENPAEQLAARWTRVRHELERTGLDDSAMEQVGDRLQQVTHEPGEVRRTLVVAGGRVVLDEVQPGHNPAPEVLDEGALPDLGAWLTAEEQVLPFVLAKVDREGADLEVHRAVAGAATDEESVTGQTFNITKVAVGDWAQHKYQQYAENAWERNAREVAEAVVSVARKHATSAVFVAGEVRARSEVMKALEETGAEIGPYLEMESGGRAAGASETSMWAAVRERLRTLQGSRDADVVARLEEARGRGGGGCDRSRRGAPGTGQGTGRPARGRPRRDARAHRRPRQLRRSPAACGGDRSGPAGRPGPGGGGRPQRGRHHAAPRLDGPRWRRLGAVALGRLRAGVRAARDLRPWIVPGRSALLVIVPPAQV